MSGPDRAALLLALALFATPAVAARAGADPAAPPRTDMVAVVHLHTALVDGAADPLALAHAARAAGVDALVVTDHFLERVAYAPWPLGNVAGVAWSRPSVLAEGPERYFEALRTVERQVPGVLLLPGLEVSPYARWSGSLLAGTLRLEGWHRHVLVIGIEDARAVRRLPAAGNRAGGRYGLWSLAFGLPAAGLVWSVARCARPVYRTARLDRFVLRRRRIPWGAGLLGLASAAILAVGFPYRIEWWSPVGAEPGAAPFRLLEDRVRALGGATCWAHPEAAAGKEAIGVPMVTGPYPGMVGSTDADAFAALPEGVRRLLPAGGLWDRALLRHLEGERRSAPFALAELDEHAAAKDVDLRLLQTVFQVESRTHAGLLEALRAGRMYGRWTPAGRPPLVLRRFEAAIAGEPPAGAGGTVAGEGAVTVRVAIGGGDGSAVVARLVRRGEVIWSRRETPPFDETITDDPPRPAYYRLDVEGAYPYRLVANPIFVVRSQRGDA